MSFELQPGLDQQHFEQPRAHRRLPKGLLPYVAVTAFALSAGYVGVSEFFGGVGSVLHDIGHAAHDLEEAGTPKPVVMGDARLALESVSIPTDRPVVRGTVSGTATVGTYDYVSLINDVPFVGSWVGKGIKDGSHKYETVTQPDVVQIMAPANAITGRKVSELPNAANGDPRFAVTLTVDADSLYPRLQTPPKGSQLGSPGEDDGAWANFKTFVTGNSTDSQYTEAAANFGSNRAEVYCAQAIAPLIQADFQKYFYVGAELGEPSGATLKGKDGSTIKQYYQDIADKTVPVTVNLVNSKGQPVNPATYKLNDAGYLMSNTALARQLGAGSNQKTTSSFSSECLSDPLAVEQQVAIQEGYLSHSGGAASVNVSYGG